MRILIVTKKVPFPTHDGETIALRNMLDHYLALGWGVDLLCMRTPKHPYGDQVPEGYEQVSMEIVDVHSSPSYLGAFLNLFESTPYHLRRFTSQAFSGALSTKLSQKQYEIIQLESLYLLSYIPCVRKFSQAKIIYRSHNIEGNIWERLSMLEGNPFKKWYIHLQAQRLLYYERKQIGVVDFILSISLADTKSYAKYLKHTKVAFLPTGFEVTANSEISAVPDNLYFLGALDWLPNLQGIQRFLASIWPLVHSKNPSAMFHLAGRHAPEGFGQKMPEGVTYYGEVPDAKEFIENKGICIVPLWAGSGLKIKLVEALAASKPVITTSVGVEGLPVEVEFLCGIADGNQEMANLILDYLERPNEIHEQAKKAATVIQDSFSNRAIQKKLQLTLKNWAIC